MAGGQYTRMLCWFVMSVRGRDLGLSEDLVTVDAVIRVEMLA